MQRNRAEWAEGRGKGKKEKGRRGESAMDTCFKKHEDQPPQEQKKTTKKTLAKELRGGK